MPVETDVNWEVAELPEEIPEPVESSSPAVMEEVVVAPTAPPPKPRKPRAPKGAAKSAKRKSTAQRKAKQPEVASD
jgi:hypothetical protein